MRIPVAARGRAMLSGVMFTGIVEATASVAALSATPDGGHLVLASVAFARELALGESVAVNGCCLTVVQAEADRVHFDLLRQTLDLTNLGDLVAGQAVNLERAMRLGDRLSGHIVQGHIDSTGTILAYEAVGMDHRLQVQLHAEHVRQVLPKGSITLDGMSLTVAECDATSVTAWITPHTHAVTTLRAARAGQRVNVEFDMMGQYVWRYLQHFLPQKS
jgi:riboflavin synthase